MPNGLALPSYLLAFVVSLLYAFWLFPVDFILGEGPHWAASGGDSLLHIIGMRYFLADEWHFPLFQTQLIAPPEGVNIIYTDSLPLFALIAKLFRPLLPEQINYFGIWYFLSYVLQGIASVFLLCSLGVKGLLPDLAGTVMAISFPALLHRTGQAALCGHFLVLFALGLYFRSVRQPAFGRLWKWLALLCWLALLVHAYLFVMVFGVFVKNRLAEEPRRGCRCCWGVCSADVGLRLLPWRRGHVGLWLLLNERAFPVGATTVGVVSSHESHHRCHRRAV
jgi:hypothetical protein